MSTVAQELVNKFYQPLGLLRCSVSADEMWKYAKARALDVAEMFIEQEPMYTGNLNPRWDKWTKIRNEIIAMP